jgi:hypothetical protein
VSVLARRRKPKPVNAADRLARSLRALAHTGSTSRVLNLVEIEAKSGKRPEYAEHPLFRNRILNSALILKHRVRNDDVYLFDEVRPLATKIIIPFDRTDLGLGGRSVFVGQRGWVEMLADACNASGRLTRDLTVLNAIDALPSLDPFLLREHLRQHDLTVAHCYFTLSPADYDAMQGFVGMEIGHLIELAFGDHGGSRRSQAGRMVEALLAADFGERLSPLRQTLGMEGHSFKDGVFAWKGLLYYKWMLTRLWPRLTEICDELGRLEVTGLRDEADERYVALARRRLQGALPVERHAILRTLKIYDDAFEQLVHNRRPQAFRDFLLSAPELFLNLGERVGAIAHVASYWRYRFPEGQPLTAGAEEAIDILQDFETSLAIQLTP